MHYNNMGLFCNPNIIANNKERNFQKLAVANHNSSQTLDLLHYHNIPTRTIASPSQLPNLIKSQTFLIITASIHCLRLTLYRKLFATNPSPQRLSKSTQNSIGFWYKIRRKHFGILKMPLKVCDYHYIENYLQQTHHRNDLANRLKSLSISDVRSNKNKLGFSKCR